MHTLFINDWISPRLQEPLLAARAAAQGAQRIIGYVGADIPVELILAAKAQPVRLRGKANAPTPRADEYLESAFQPETRAIAEQWLSGELDFLDAVIFPRSNDSSQRLYYYLCELQRRKLCSGPKPLLYDVATIARTTSVDHTIHATQQLATLLGTNVAQLPQAMQRCAQRAEQIARLQALDVIGSTAFCVRRAAEFDWSDAFDQALATWLDHATRAPSMTRILLAGSAPPDDRLHRAVETANGSIVAELVEPQLPPLLAVSDAIAALAQRHHAAVSPAQHMLRSPTWIAAQAQTARAHGVVLWMIEEDETLPWEVAGQVRALQAAPIPTLVLTRQLWRADAALTLITDFVRSLESHA